MTSVATDGLWPRVAVVQFAAALGDVERNLAAAVDHIEALSGRADLAVFPELFTTGYSMEDLDHASLAEEIPKGPTVKRLRQAAAHTGVALTGTIIEKDGDALYDTAFVIDSWGAFVGRYRKTHLHPTELQIFGEGRELCVVDLGRGVRLGLAICFEHAFPELFAELALAGATVVAVPSAVKEGFGYLMDLRTRARAQDNQFFVAASNLVGDDGTTRWCGGSAIVDPRGSVLARSDECDQAIASAIDLSLIESERRQEPLFVHRRPELYARLRDSDGSAALNPAWRSSG